MTTPVHSPAPGTPQTGTKAVVATAVSFVCAFVALWVADTGHFTPKEIAADIVASAIASGLTGGAAFVVKNKPKAL